MVGVRRRIEEIVRTKEMERVHILVLAAAVWAFPAIAQMPAMAPQRVHALVGDPRKVTFIPHWYPQAQFAGYYVAVDAGIYRKYGLDVVILPGGPDNPSIKLLADRKADFATIWLTSAVQSRDDGIKLVNIAQIIQKSALMFVAKKSSGIRTPQDMNGKKIGVWGGDFTLQPLAFITKYRLDVKLVNQPYSVNLFLRDGVAVTSAMWYNEYHVIIDSGYNPDELVTFFFSDHDLNFPEDGIYCLDETYARDPELCMNFTAASLEGWRYAFDHPDEALEIIMKYVGQRHLRTNRAHQKWMLDRMKDIILLETPGAGKLNRDEYVKVCGELRRRGFIHEVPEYEGFYKDCVVHVPR